MLVSIPFNQGGNSYIDKNGNFTGPWVQVSIPFNQGVILTKIAGMGNAGFGMASIPSNQGVILTVFDIVMLPISSQFVSIPLIRGYLTHAGFILNGRR